MNKFCRATHSLHKFYLEKVPLLADIPLHNSLFTQNSIISYYLDYSNHMSNTEIMMYNSNMAAHRRHIVTNLNLNKFQMDIYYNSFEWLVIQKGYLYLGHIWYTYLGQHCILNMDSYTKDINIQRYRRNLKGNSKHKFY